MKKYIILLITILLVIPFFSKAIVDKSDQVYVTDDANILNKDSEEYIRKYSEFLYQNRKIDFYVVTVKNLEGLNLVDYTNIICNKFDISDNGLIILVSKEERQLRIQVGSNLVDTINSVLIEQYIQTYFLPYLEREEWNDGIINGYSALYKFICEEYGIDASSMDALDKPDFITKYKTIIMMLIIFSITEFVKIYQYYQKKLKITPSGKIPDRDAFLLVVIILGNIFVVSITYMLRPIFLIFTLVFEAYLLYVNLFLQQKNKSFKKQIRSAKKKHR